MPKHNIVTTELPSVIKGDADWRIYRPLQLPNGVTCLLVNDKESKTTACSVSVGIGASADPRSLSGLAHFTGKFGKSLKKLFVTLIACYTSVH